MIQVQRLLCMTCTVNGVNPMMGHFYSLEPSFSNSIDDFVMGGDFNAEDFLYSLPF